MVIMSVVITKCDEERINEIVRNERAINKSDFVRQAIREKIAREGQELHGRADLRRKKEAV